MMSMRRVTGIGIVTLWLVVPRLCCADAVQVVDGHVTLIKPSGQTVALTRGGIDSEPVLSPDGTAVAFLRTLIPAPGEYEDGAYELRTVDVRLGKESLLYRPRDASSLDATWLSSALGPLDFSPDGRLVYFQRREAQTSFSVLAVDRTNRHVRVVAKGGASYEVLKAGRYAGQLLQSRRELDKSGVGFIYVWCLLSEGGRVVRRWPLEANIDEIRDTLLR